MTTKHTDGAVIAAQKIDNLQGIHFVCLHSDKRKEDIATIIDQETISPDLLNLFAERDRLREALTEIAKRKERFRKDWTVANNIIEDMIEIAQSALAKATTNPKPEVK